MNATAVKLAAALIAVAAIVGITQWRRHPTVPEYSVAMGPSAQTLVGPMTHELGGGSSVKLAAGASIRTLFPTGRRGFEHLAGRVEVSVAKGKGEFLVTTPYGEVRALGTRFTMDLIDGVAANTQARVQLLAVEVQEGSVEVRNDKGKTTVGENHEIVVAASAAPYDFSQDAQLPAQLKKRIASMAAALEAGDAAAWIANYNLDYMFKLAKGQEAYDPQRFGGSEADLERLRQGFGDVANLQEFRQRFLGGGGFNSSGKIYVGAVTLSADGRHAQAECVGYKSETSMVITTPQWHFFDNNWWQVDD